MLCSAKSAASTIVAQLFLPLVSCFTPVVLQESFEGLQVLRFLVDPTKNLTMFHEYSSIKAVVLEYSTNLFLSLLLKNFQHSI